jgi:hypothetical protein
VPAAAVATNVEVAQLSVRQVHIEVGKRQDSELWEEHFVEVHYLRAFDGRFRTDLTIKKCPRR